MLRLTPEPDDDGVIRNDGSVIRVRIEILLKNDGEKAAGETVLNVIAPRSFGLRWCGPRGEGLEDMDPPAETPEELTDGRPDAGSRILEAHVPRVTRRSWYSRHASLYFDMPPEGSGACRSESRRKRTSFPMTKRKCPRRP